MSANPSEPFATAGDYVLGLLSDAEKQAFEQLLSEDAALRAEVRATRERLFELDLTAPSEAVPPTLWDKIAAQLNSAAADRPASATVVSLGSRPPRSHYWKGFATASAAAALLVAIGTSLLWQTANFAQPKVVVVLVDQGSKPGAIIEAYDDDSVRVIPLENFVVPEGRVIQVWTLPDAKTGPVSLGLLPQVRESKLSGPHLPLPKPDQLYEFTLEPAGGSPTGRPTGPILVKGLAKSPPI